MEYQAWARSFHYVVKVRDHTFWSQSAVSACLSRALQFMTGDREYSFSFQPGDGLFTFELHEVTGLCRQVRKEVIRMESVIKTLDVAAILKKN